jgi:GH25 family lysozyme M1 (1,4-beta-N-acetylmuramidase)/uncharacterized protein YraI
MTVLGLDISKWDGIWDPRKSKSAGMQFAFIKASQATFADPMFATNWQKAKDAGLIRGAYHFLDYTRPAVDQANFFADLLDRDPGELPPAFDFEQKRPDNNTALARSYARDFVERVKARSYKPIIYTGPAFWSEYGEKTAYWAGFPLWIAHYTTAVGPTVPDPWMRWVFWQFSVKGQGELFGTQSLSVDVNRFDGSMDDLLVFAGRPAGVGGLESAVAALTQRTTNLEQRLAALEGSGGSTGGTPPSTPPTPPPADAGAVWAVCKASGLNVRSGGGTNYPVVGGITYGQRVQVLSTKDGWAQLESPAGWCSERYLEYEQSSTGGTPPASATYATCTASGLNVRSGPGVGYSIVGGLVYGQRAKVLARQGGWAQFETPSGWSSENYLRFDSTAA